ncbi:MAG: hypothetical protein EBR95_05715 [Verrucomicrobia bacterium]|nr:hypothetical protein [Verrucomicrobiota bacterium]
MPTSQPPSPRADAAQAPRSFWIRFFFRPSGQPKKLLRLILFRTNGNPRGFFRFLVVHANGRPRRAFRQWMEDPLRLRQAADEGRSRSDPTLTARGRRIHAVLRSAIASRRPEDS